MVITLNSLSFVSVWSLLNFDAPCSTLLFAHSFSKLWNFSCMIPHASFENKTFWVGGDRTRVTHMIIAFQASLGPLTCSTNQIIRPFVCLICIDNVSLLIHILPFRSYLYLLYLNWRFIYLPFYLFRNPNHISIFSLLLHLFGSNVSFQSLSLSLSFIYFHFFSLFVFHNFLLDTKFCILAQVSRLRCHSLIKASTKSAKFYLWISYLVDPQVLFSCQHPNAPS